MEIYVVFGLPGAGKTFVGYLMQKYFGFYQCEADDYMPHELQEVIRKQKIINNDLRDVFFDKIVKKVKELQIKHDKIVVTQVFIKEKYREQFLRSFPQAKFILVKAADATREERLLKQKAWQLDLEYWRKMAAIFDTPQIAYFTLDNNSQGEESIKNQLQKLLK